MYEPADVTRQFLETIINIIGRKTSEEYAAVTIRNLLKKLQTQYPFVRDMEIKNTRYKELESRINVHDSLNDIDKKNIGNALKALIKIIMSSIDKTAGYFFIREIREKIGIEYDTILLNDMDVDLTLLQSKSIVEKKSINLLQIENSDVVRRILKTLLELVEKQTSKTYAIDLLARCIDETRKQNPVLAHVSIMDVRYTLGAEEVVIAQDVNQVGQKELGQAIEAVLNKTDMMLLEQGRIPVADDLTLNLTREYLTKLQEMGVTITSHGLDYDTIFRQVITALINTLSKRTTITYAIYIMNTLLRNIDSSYEFLKTVKILPAPDTSGGFRILITGSFKTVDETDGRRAIQRLLSDIMDSLGEQSSDQLIKEFKEALDKKYLLKIEDMGVNLHMIALHQELGGGTGDG